MHYGRLSITFILGQAFYFIALILRNRTHEVVLVEVAIFDYKRIPLRNTGEQCAGALEVEPPVMFSHKLPCAFIHHNVNVDYSELHLVICPVVFCCTLAYPVDALEGHVRIASPEICLRTEKICVAKTENHIFA